MVPKARRPLPNRARIKALKVSQKTKVRGGARTPAEYKHRKKEDKRDDWTSLMGKTNTKGPVLKKPKNKGKMGDVLGMPDARN